MFLHIILLILPSIFIAGIIPFIIDLICNEFVGRYSKEVVQAQNIFRRVL